MSLTVLLNRKLYHTILRDNFSTLDNIEFNQILSRIITDLLNTEDYLFGRIPITIVYELQELLNTSDEIQRNIITQRLVSDVFNTRDYLNKNLELERSITDNFTFSDFLKDIMETPYLPEPFDLEQRVQFIYNNAMCEGSIVEIFTDPVYEIEVEVDVCNDYYALPQNQSRVRLDISKYEIIKIFPPEFI